MGFGKKHLALATVMAAMALTGAGCDKSRDEMRPDMDRVMTEHGPQSKDLREMASRLAPQLLACRDIVANQYKITVVMKDMDNQTEDMRGRDMNIYVAKLTGLLNSNVAADRIQFVENARVLASMQGSELGNADPFGEAGRVPTTSARIIPQYALYGTVYSMGGSKTTYYLFQFHLTNLQTGLQSWSGEYEVRTLNVN